MFFNSNDAINEAINELTRITMENLDWDYILDYFRLNEEYQDLLDREGYLSEEEQTKLRNIERLKDAIEEWIRSKILDAVPSESEIQTNFIDKINDYIKN